MKAAIVGIAGTALSPGEAALFAARPPAGIILFGRNIADPAQLRALVAALRRVLPAGAVLMVDQEGGRVARLRPPHWRAHPPAAAIGACFAADPRAGLRAAWLSGALIGLDCRAFGFDVVCAPVLDVRAPGAHDVIGDRAFAADPDSVARLGWAMAQGLLAAGIQPVMKHVPGHGRARVDSHLELPVVTEQNLAADFAPFARNAALPWAMSAHILYTSLDPSRVATFSPVVIGEIVRGRIGFRGVLVSDDLAMQAPSGQALSGQALSGAPGERAAAALAAGCDIALYCSGVLAASADVLAACPDLAGPAAARFGAARRMAQGRHRALDPAALALARDRLLA